MNVVDADYSNDDDMHPAEHTVDCLHHRHLHIYDTMFDEYNHPQLWSHYYANFDCYSSNDAIMAYADGNHAMYCYKMTILWLSMRYLAAWTCHRHSCKLQWIHCSDADSDCIPQRYVSHQMLAWVSQTIGWSK